MSHVKTRALPHFVWTTWERMPSIKPEVASSVHRCTPARRSIPEATPSGLTQNPLTTIQLPHTCPLQRVFGAQRLQRRALARRMSLENRWHERGSVSECVEAIPLVLKLKSLRQWSYGPHIIKTRDRQSRRLRPLRHRRSRRQ